MKTEEEIISEEEKVQNIIAGPLIELRSTFWKNREAMQVLQETGHPDVVDALEDAGEAINKALAEYVKVFNKGEKR